MTFKPSFCRGDRTRTCDSLVPNQERYQLRYTPLQYSCFLIADAKVWSFFVPTKFFDDYFQKNIIFR